MAELTRSLRMQIGLVVSADYDHDLDQVREDAEKIAEKIGCYASEVVAYVAEREQA